jgi:hypothetical protein
LLCAPETATSATWLSAFQRRCCGGPAAYYTGIHILPRGAGGSMRPGSQKLITRLGSTDPMTAVPPTCSCGRFAVGMCRECGVPVCQAHGVDFASSFLCADHYWAARRVTEVQERDANAEREADAARLASDRGRTLMGRLDAAMCRLLRDHRRRAGGFHHDGLSRLKRAPTGWDGFISPANVPVTIGDDATGIFFVGDNRSEAVSFEEAVNRGTLHWTISHSRHGSTDAHTDVYAAGVDELLLQVIDLLDKSGDGST